MKKRLLCLMASLLLCGAVSAQHFEADAHAHDNNMPVVAQVVLDGDAVTTGGYELGAFIGDDVRGSAQIQTGLGNTYWIQVYYSTDTEAAATVSFKLYDGDEEYTSETTLTIDPEGYGTPGTPQVIVVNRAVTQTTTLAQGWTWWSTPIELSNIDGLTMLENSLGHNGLTIKSYNDFTTNYYGITEDDLWYGGLESINNEEFYMIETNSVCPVVMVGAYANPSNHPITINENWNWIGYPVSNTQLVSVAMSNLESANEDLLKDKNDFTTYYEGYGWYPDDFVMAPGKGYKYYSTGSNSKTFTYVSGRNEVVEKPQEKMQWASETDKFPYSLSIIAVLTNDGEEIDDEIEIGAFVGDECRGTTKLRFFAPTGRYYALLSVAGIDNEIVSFKTLEKESITSISFKQDDIVGSLDNPFVINFGQSTDAISYISVYPNPVERNQEFKILVPEEEQLSEIIITDMFGSIICKKPINTNSFHGITTPGVYLIKTICKSGSVYISKVVVE